MNQISRISPVTDAEAARLVQPGTLADLASEITATPVPQARGHHGQPSPAAARPRLARIRRRWLIWAPLAAGLAAAVLIVMSIGSPGQRVGPVVVGPAPAQAQVLSFSKHGGYITVLVRNPLADPARYRAEFARYHLKVTLKLIPVSPSLVGTLIYLDGNITPITARGRCHTGGGGSACPVGVRIPDDFRGRAHVVFGRAARPGEQYESTASAFAPGEAMHGMSIQGQTVAQVVAALHRRHVTVPLFNLTRHGIAVNVRHIPGTWYVYGAVPWAPGQVLLFAGPAKTQPAPGQPAGPQPRPTPTPASR
jgi:hypothetical protein